MSSRYRHALKQGLLHTPPWFIADNLHYEVLNGSVAYGVSSDMSDMDIYGWVIPPRDYVFPNQVRGEIEGFGTKGPRFEQWQQHHVEDKSSRTVFDFSLYSVVKYVQLCMENNPNMLDSLFVPMRCVLHITGLGSILRDARREFLHKGATSKLIGYARSQLSKADGGKTNDPDVLALRELERELGIPHSITYNEVQEYLQGTLTSEVFDRIDGSEIVNYTNRYKRLVEKNRRLEGVKRFGYDPKFLYHVVRLASQCEQILSECDLVLDEKARREMMKEVRSGNWNLEDVRRWYTDKELQLERLRETSRLPDKPDESRIKQLLMQILETHYGNLDALVSKNDHAEALLRQIGALVQPYMK